MSTLKSGEVKDGAYKYRIFRCCASSDKYGPCEVCGEFVSDVHHQTESRSYEFKLGRKIHSGFTTHECKNLFGHRECVESKRRTPCLQTVA